ncbi:MAG: 16S rRNA (cytosine(1402)-N(4))-methyltransferase RsmH [Pseudomonadota bacterium]|nr:16S rRNA (cytosine(1402)-N(4))-methyltransferase RsmH [Pseudomonadota bacterium]
MIVSQHIPVMMNEAIEALNVRDNLDYIDATFGGGGYSEEILKKADCKLLSIDKDPTVKNYASKLKAKYKKRFTFVNDDFGNLESIIKENNKTLVSGGIVADLGVSSFQLDNSERGFSFNKDGPLDMRMSGEGVTAQELIYSLDEKELARILWHYGDEEKSRAIAKMIIKERNKEVLDTTFKLVKLIKRVKKSDRKKKTHPATKSFQALRIATNQEFKSLEKLLMISEKILLPGARLVLITFHSLEDRIVKFFFNEISGKQENFNRHLPQVIKIKKVKFKVINKKPIMPSSAEIKSNIRARSAKLRVVERMVI